MNQLVVSIFAFILWICLNSVEAGNSTAKVPILETVKCVDKLPNCAAIVSQNACRENLTVGTQCSFSCNLCSTTTVRRVKRWANRNRRTNSRTRPNVARSNSATNSRPNYRRPTRSRSNSRTYSRPTASKTRVQVRRPVTKKRPTLKTHAKRPKRPVRKTYAKRPKTNVRRPNSKTHVKRPSTQPKVHAKASNKTKYSTTKIRTKHVSSKNPKQQIRNKARTNQRQPYKSISKASKPKVPAKPIKNNQSINFKPIGPYQIRVNRDVMLSSRMQQAKLNAIKVTKEFDQMNGEVDGIVQKLDETLKQMDEDEKSQVSKLQMDLHFNNLHLFQPMFKSGHGFRSFIRPLKEGAKQVGSFVSNHTPQPIKNLFSQSASFVASAIGHGNSRLQISYVVHPTQNHRLSLNNKMLKPDTAFDFNQQSGRHEKLAKTLETFATDFNKVTKMMIQFMSEAESSDTEIKAIVSAAESNEINIQQARSRVQQVKSDFSKIKNEVVETGELFKRTATDFGNVADAFDKNRGEPQAERKPASEEMPKKKREGFSESTSETSSQRGSNSGGPNSNSNPGRPNSGNQSGPNGDSKKSDQNTSNNNQPKKEEQPKEDTKPEKEEEPKEDGKTGRRRAKK